MAALRVGNVFEDIGEGIVDVAEAVGDVATSVVDAISDAGAEIGAVLKFIAPIVSMVPGLGTAVGVALSAAGAYAAGDSIPDAIIGIAGGAMPGPVAKAAFNAAADLTVTAVEGGDVGAAAIRSMRETAGTFGGPQAVAAFDTGLAVARGEPIGDSAWALARQAVAQNGTAALAAFDAAVAVKNGGDAGDVVIAAARAYIAGTGGAPALVAFDTGVAIAAGKSLQDAGFYALRNFVAGNDFGKRALKFLDTMRRASIEGRPLVDVLIDELTSEVGQYGIAKASATLGQMLDQWVPSWDGWGSDALARHLNVSELMARAGQAIMRSGVPDEVLFKRLTQTSLASAIERYGERTIASRALNASHAEVTAQIAAEQREARLMLVARMPSDSLSYRTAQAEIAADLAEAERAADVGEWLPGTAAAVPELVQGPRSSKTSVAGDVALGGLIASACLALVWWSRSK